MSGFVRRTSATHPGEDSSKPAAKGFRGNILHVFRVLRLKLSKK